MKGKHALHVKRVLAAQCATQKRIQTSCTSIYAYGGHEAGIRLQTAIMCAICKDRFKLQHIKVMRWWRIGASSADNQHQTKFKGENRITTHVHAPLDWTNVTNNPRDAV